MANTSKKKQKMNDQLRSEFRQLENYNQNQATKCRKKDTIFAGKKIQSILVKRWQCQCPTYIKIDELKNLKINFEAQFIT